MSNSIQLKICGNVMDVADIFLLIRNGMIVSKD